MAKFSDIYHGTPEKRQGVYQQLLVMRVKVLPMAKYSLRDLRRIRRLTYYRRLFNLLPS